MLIPLLLSALLCVIPTLATYAPQKEICPTESLIRAAEGISDDEVTYRVARKAVADVALKTWLAKTDSGFGVDELPTVHTEYSFHEQGADMNRLR